MIFSRPAIFLRFVLPSKVHAAGAYKAWPSLLPAKKHSSSPWELAVADEEGACTKEQEC